jgi:hypothetical protein
MIMQFVECDNVVLYEFRMLHNNFIAFTQFLWKINMLNMPDETQHITK